METYAGLEFYFSRFLPDDLAPYLEELSFYGTESKNLANHRSAAKTYQDYSEELHGATPAARPDLKLLEAYKGLRRIELREAQISDLSWLEQVNWLKTLMFSSHPDMEDFSPLAFATKLEVLHIFSSNMKDLTPLASMSKLEELILFHVPVEDLSPLSTITALKEVSFSDVEVTDISCLAPLHNLEKLILTEVELDDYALVSSFPKLKVLGVSKTRIDDLSVLPNIPTLEELFIIDCKNITDLSPLDRYPKLKPVNTRGTGVE